jgi:phosphomannomutase
MGRELDRIRGMHFRVAMDCCGGAGIPIDYVLLDHLYCRLKRVDGIPGQFSRPIEPTPDNLAGLCSELARDGEDYDVAFVTDCDNDRCVIVGRDPSTGAYIPLEEDYTFAIAVDQVLANAPQGSTVVTNWSTSQTLYDVASSHNANLRRAPTGEVYTAGEALQFRAAIAGEGSCAGVIDPRVGLGRDCLVAMWHILGALARKQAGLVSIAEALPRYYRVRQDHPCDLPVGKTAALLDVLQVHYAQKDGIHLISREDGLVVCFGDRSRIHIRNSNTEPILRVRSEARTEREAQALIDEARSVIAEHAR